LNNKKPEGLLVFDNALAINKVDSSDFFNQLKGIKLKATFEDGQIHRMSMKGAAENIYYAMDEQKKFIGMNHSTAQIIDIEFEKGEPAKVIFRNQLLGKLTPMGQIPKEEKEVRGFKWLEESRPRKVN
jgi:hypothetical protein